MSDDNDIRHGLNHPGVIHSAIGRSGNLAICAATDGGVESDVLI